MAALGLTMESSKPSLASLPPIWERSGPTQAPTPATRWHLEHCASFLKKTFWPFCGLPVCFKISSGGGSGRFPASLGNGRTLAANDFTARTIEEVDEGAIAIAQQNAHIVAELVGHD